MAFPLSRSMLAISVVLLSVSGSVSQDSEPPVVSGEEVVQPEVTANQEVALAVVGEIPSFASVVSTCTPHPENVCVAPTTTYLDSLASLNLPADDFNQTLADLVIALVPLAPSGEQCGTVDSEVPTAIRLIASRAIDAGQIAQFISIATTIEECTNFETAAIAPVASSN